MEKYSIIGVLIVAAIVTAIVLYIRGRKKATGKSLLFGAPSPPEGGVSQQDCDDARIAYDNAVQTLCVLKADEAAAWGNVENLIRAIKTNDDIAKGLLVAAAAAGVAANVAAATIFGIPVAVGLWALAATLFTIAMAIYEHISFLAGQLSVANTIAEEITRNRLAWEQTVADLRENVNASCTPEEASEFFSRPPPC